MKYLFTILYIMVGCFTKESVNNDSAYKITIMSLKESDKPYPVIILTNKENNKSKFPKHCYQLDKADFKNTEKKCSSIGGRKNSKSVLYIEINEGTKLKKYFFDKKQGLDILNKFKSKPPIIIMKA